MNPPRLLLALVASLFLAVAPARSERFGLGDFTGEPTLPKVQSLEANAPGGHRPSSLFDAPKWVREKPGYTVVVDVTIDEHGRSESSTIHASDDPTNSQILNVIASKLTADLKQEPPRKNGQPVKSVVRVPFFFPVDLDEGPDANLAPRPKLMSGAPVTFPAALAAKRENGGAIAELRIAADGTVQTVDILAVSHRACAEAVRNAVETWRFEPAKQDGLAVKSRWRIAIEFNADGNVGDIKWRIAPRPYLGSFTITLPGSSIAAGEAEPPAKLSRQETGQTRRPAQVRATVARPTATAARSMISMSMTPRKPENAAAISDPSGVRSGTPPSQPMKYGRWTPKAPSSSLPA